MTGANWFQVNRQADGTRASSSVSYLHPNLERENLHVLTGLQVMRVLFDEEQRATGVEYIDNAFDRLLAHARAARGDPLRRGDRICRSC